MLRHGHLRPDVPATDGPLSNAAKSQLENGRSSVSLARLDMATRRPLSHPHSRPRHRANVIQVPPSITSPDLAMRKVSEFLLNPDIVLLQYAENILSPFDFYEQCNRNDVVIVHSLHVQHFTFDHGTSYANCFV